VRPFQLSVALIITRCVVAQLFPVTDAAIQHRILGKSPVFLIPTLGLVIEILWVLEKIRKNLLVLTAFNIIFQVVMWNLAARPGPRLLTLVAEKTLDLINRVKGNFKNYGAKKQTGS